MRLFRVGEFIALCGASWGLCYGTATLDTKHMLMTYGGALSLALYMKL